MPNDLHYYLRVWNLSDPRLLADTATSKVYAVTGNTVIGKNETVVLKILSTTGEHDEQNAAIALRCFNGKGAVKLLANDASALLIEYVDGESLESLVATGEDHKATGIIAEILNNIHNSYRGLPPQELTPLWQRFESLFIKSEADKRHGLDSVFVHAAQVATLLLNSQREVRILHGDIHHENIRYSKTRGWLAIDPKGVVGERTYDTANALCNPWGMKKLVENTQRLLTNTTLLAKALKLDHDRILRYAFVHACLSASWLLEDGGDVDHALNMASIIQPHIS